MVLLYLSFFFFFNDTATTEIYTLSLHDALPISEIRLHTAQFRQQSGRDLNRDERAHGDRKSTRLNSSHGYISYAVFCLKKKKQTKHSAIRSDSQTMSSNSLNSRYQAT